MSGISSWLLGIAGIVILSVLTEFVLPEGQINKYIKVIFSFVTLLVIIMPLPKIFGKEFDISKFFGSDSSLQKDYLEQVNLDKLTALNKSLAEDVKEQGLCYVEISINANILSEELEIYGIFVDLSALEFEPKFGSHDITKAKLKIIETIKSYSILKNVEVKFNE